MKIQRGKILRDASLGAGIVSSEGKNFEFDLVKCWHGDTPPRVDMVVELIISSDDEIQVLKPVDTAVLGKEQAEKLALEAQQLASKGLDQSRVVGKRIAQATGNLTLVLIGLITATWVFLPFIDVSFMGWPSAKSLSLIEFTQILNMDQRDFLQRFSSRDSGGIWLTMLSVSLISIPIAAIFKPNYQRMTSALPLVFTLASVTAFYFKVRAFVNDAHDNMRAFAFGGKSMQDALDQMMDKAMDSYSLEYGFYLSLLLSIALLVSVSRKNTIRN